MAKNSSPAQQYVDVDSIKSTNLITVLDPRAFVQIVTNAPDNTIYRSKSQFGCETRNAIAIIERLGFDTIDERLAAIDFGFGVDVESQVYQRAIDGQFRNADEYRAVTKEGFQDAACYRDALARGFLDRLAEINAVQPPQKGGFYQNHRTFTLDQVYKFATSNGFRDADHLIEALSAGFDSGAKFDMFKSGEFPDRDTITAAFKLGVSKFADYQRASKYECQKPQELEMVDELIQGARELLGRHSDEESDPSTLPEVFMYDAVSGLIPRGPVAFSKFSETILRAQETLIKKLGAHPRWLLIDGHRITSERIRHTLTGGNVLRHFVSFDPEAETVRVLPEARKIETTIVVDASNVARHDASDTGRNDARIDYLELIDEKLRSLGFREIDYIADASLRHYVDNEERFTTFKKNNRWTTVPAGTSADTQIITKLREGDTFVITNDRFLDHTTENPTLSELIGRCRISFVIDGQKVDFDSEGIARALKVVNLLKAKISV